MKISSKRKFLKPAILFATGVGFSLLALYFFFGVTLVRARIIDINEINQRLENQKRQNPDQPNRVQKVVIQRGYDHDKGLDLSCLLWEKQSIINAWTRNSKDRDFFLDYYVPANKKAIICTTPAIATAITAASGKPFLYEVYPVESGWRVRVIIGLTEVRDPCQLITGNTDCANSFLEQQITVRYQE
ncbi:hypothetical protein [Calothrix sp. PCC 6303]|uniref:hypothetical protein n=1 Tax=Calothrix sp. PCC 6303 TaxID=1170562 RepID=UPI0002A02E7C|nr:hypothetical protein [Calothrix sp. PCC 6303]AFZ03847.1 hypothetical protein Cal6303_4950 [Calothrix sp. PCC 6303]